ncbi:MAG: DUF1634 domain-containing protein [Nevskiaceae bacterium]|nr:MAG: DUF1634 domain-containing protein [Nevskiaceae bacterium]TBR73544.1 MAG: DUF1634 domain-containing protein [Nevskiaceae bacterium]
MVEVPAHTVESRIGVLLRAGVALSAGLVFAGAVLYLWHHGDATADYRTFHLDRRTLGDWRQMVRGLGVFEGTAFMQLGLLVLVATPVARVGLAAYGFFRARDRLYTVLALVVLGILLGSLLFMR